MATYSSIFAWRIPWTEMLGGLQSMGSQSVRHDLSDIAQQVPFVHVCFYFHYSRRRVIEDLVCTHTKSLQSCATLCDPMDRSPPDSSVHGILQTRILEWVAMPSFRGSSQSGDQTHICLCLLHCRPTLYPLSHLGSSGNVYPLQCSCLENSMDRGA